MVKNVQGEVSNILIVDDTPATLQLLSQVLKAAGYKARPVSSGKMALDAARNLCPDLVLLDIHMADMSGYAVCRRLKSQENLKEVPILFISGLNDPIDKLTAFQCGGIDYVTKPFQFDEVLARVETHLKLRRLQEELKLQNVHLEEQVCCRTRQLAEARDKLLIVDKAKADFLILISHELRTPLNGLFGIGDMLLSECGDAPETVTLCDLFTRSKHRVITILEDALLLTQIEIKPEMWCALPTDLRPVMDRAIQNTARAETANFTLKGQDWDSKLVYGEPKLLIKAMEAMLETAVKFSKQGNVIHVCCADLLDDVSVTVEAFGRTIPTEVIDRFFDVLAISEVIVPGGDLGLRMPVAASILSLFNGTLSVENLDPAGIRLTAILKRASVAMDDPALSSRASR